MSSKKVLFICNSLPVPPRNGVELPVARLLAHMAGLFQVDLLVLGDRDPIGSSREADLPAGVRIFRALPDRRTALARGLGELAGLEPAYFETGFHGKDLAMLFQTEYDLAWVSPVSCFGFVRYARRHGHKLARKVGIGLNDATPNLYSKLFAEAVSGRARPSIRRLLLGLRVPFLRRHERRYLSEADLVHVQTEAERQHLLASYGRARGPAVVVAPNGKKTELCEVINSGGASRRVLYMTTMKGEAALESRWFLLKVWPRVLLAVPDAELWLVGAPPEQGNPFFAGSRLANVRIMGFVENLATVYAQVAVAVVPVYRGTGLINRIQDAMTAGVPTISTSAPLSTIAGLIPGRHALQADRADDFAGKLAEMLLDPDLLKRLSREAKSLGTRLPSWETTLSRITASAMDGA